MPITVKHVEKIQAALRIIVENLETEYAFINIVIPEGQQVHRFVLENNDIGHLESHDPRETVHLLRKGAGA